MNPDSTGSAPRTVVRIFTRQIETPPAMPWDQRQIAKLEAEASAPAPIDSLVLRVVRISGWSPRAPAQYLAAYARRTDMVGTLVSRVSLGGRKIKLRFETAEVAKNRQRGELFAVTLLFASLLVCAACGWVADQRNRVWAEQVAELDAKVLREAHAEKRRELFYQQEAALTVAGVQRTSLSNVLDDLARIATHVAPDARIEMIHWRPGVIGFETRGPAPPLVDEPDLRQSPREPHPGTHLWGIQRVRAGS